MVKDMLSVLTAGIYGTQEVIRGRSGKRAVETSIPEGWPIMRLSCSDSDAIPSPMIDDELVPLDTGRASVMNRVRQGAVHLARAGLFALVLWCIHSAHQQRLANREHPALTDVSIYVIRSLYPTATRVTEGEAGRGRVVDAEGSELGFVIQTAPDSDRSIGFSGPTNLLVAFGPGERIIGLRVLSSGDTREHVEQILRHPVFLTAFNGLTWEEAAGKERIEAVSGATLTSYAMLDGLARRLGGVVAGSRRFPGPPAIGIVQKLFLAAVDVVEEPDAPGLWRVFGEQHDLLGLLLRTTPAADHLVGYQGPTETLIGLSPPAEGTILPSDDGNEDSPLPPGWTVSGLSIGRSFDNEPYVTYVREDRYFLKLFNGRTIDDLAAMNLQEAQVEGVSGATMTSMAVAETLIETAKRSLADQQRIAAEKERNRWKLTPRDIGTAGVTLLGVLLGLSPWRGKRWVRLPFLIVLVVYLGFVNGDMVSQALLVGWTQNGVPWQSMFGPCVLTAAALTIPLTTRHNVYCSHLCPHGAAQQLLMRRLPWQWRVGPRWHVILSAIPALLLLWVVIVAVGGLPFSLVDIEPFDAYVPAIAGWATLTLAVVGLVASLFVPMAYCKYGCPTGAILSYLKRSRLSGRVTRRDFVAMVLALTGLVLMVLQNR